MKRSSMVMAVLAGAIMLCAGSAGATTDYWWWEIKVTGKGVQLAADNATQEGVVFEERKDRIRETVYAIQDPETLEMYVAYSAGDGWEVQHVWTPGKISFNTNRNSIILPWWCPQLGPRVDGSNVYYSCGHARIQLKKNKEGDVTQARLTTLGGIYDYDPLMETVPYKAQFGGGNARGKTIDMNKVPDGARDVLLTEIAQG